MDNERQQSHRGRWIMLYVMLGFVGLSIFSLADAIKSPDPVVFKTSDSLGGLMSMTDGSIWQPKKEDDGTYIWVMKLPPAR